jgi:hypothetical protein
MVCLLARPQGREPAREHLKLYRGALQADAYAGFLHLYEGGRIVEAACWAHARRKFHEIHIAHPSPATSEAIERIAALYATEAEIRGSTPEIRKTIRQARARPLIDSMHAWFETTNLSFGDVLDQRSRYDVLHSRCIRLVAANRFVRRALDRSKCMRYLDVILQIWKRCRFVQRT